MFILSYILIVYAAGYTSYVTGTLIKLSDGTVTHMGNGWYTDTFVSLTDTSVTFKSCITNSTDDKYYFGIK